MSHDQLVHVQRLCAQFDGLRTFDDVAQWDAAALDTATSLQQLAEQTQRHRQGLVAQADDLARTRAAMPFFKRLFSSRDPELALRRQAGQVTATLQQVGVMLNDLLERIDYTPNNEKGRKELLKELRAEKKELQIAKKEIAAQKRAINHAARTASAFAGTDQGWFNSKQAASERRAIRRQRVTQLAPHENARAVIEHQITDLERRIMWVERFGKSED